MKHLKILLARLCALHLCAAVGTNHLQQQCRNLYTVLYSLFLCDQYRPSIYSYPGKDQYIFNFIHHKVAIKNNDKHKKLKAKYINLTKLNYTVFRKKHPLTFFSIYP